MAGSKTRWRAPLLRSVEETDHDVRRFGSAGVLQPRPHSHGLRLPRDANEARVSANVFGLLGLKPILGRGFRPEEEQFGRHNVVLLSHEFWRQRFAADTNILGQSITLNSEPKTVIGIMPASRLISRRAAPMSGCRWRLSLGNCNTGTPTIISCWAS